MLSFCFYFLLQYVSFVFRALECQVSAHYLPNHSFASYPLPVTHIESSLGMISSPLFSYRQNSLCIFGLKPLSQSIPFEKVVESYRELFCRRCYVYDCQSHGVQQPLPQNRIDPAPPAQCPVPGLALPTDTLRKSSFKGCSVANYSDLLELGKDSSSTGTSTLYPREQSQF